MKAESCVEGFVISPDGVSLSRSGGATSPPRLCTCRRTERRHLEGERGFTTRRRDLPLHTIHTIRRSRVSQKQSMIAVYSPINNQLLILETRPLCFCFLWAFSLAC